MQPEHVAFLIVVAIAWCWAASQVKLVVRELRRRTVSWWRVNAAQWITIKAVLFTYIAVEAWGDIPTNDGMVYLLLASQLAIFLHWLRLPSPEKADPIYLKDTP